jgi:hypothetical protein
MEQPQQQPVPCNEQRKPYTAPRLTVYGHVAALTQSVNCSAANDGSGACGAATTSNMGKASDRRLKHNIIQVGRHPGGFGLYLFDYRPQFQAAHGTARQFGVMADEVQRMRPDAVHAGPDGYLRVDYSALGISPAM